MSVFQTPTRENIPVAEYVKSAFVPISHFTNGWELHSATTLTPAEERSILREPALAIPASIVERIGRVRVLVVPFVGCLKGGDAVYFSKPEGDTHSAVWVQVEGWIDLILACRELDLHDTGFEFLATVAELLLPKLTAREMEKYVQLLEEEMRRGVTGEIDDDAMAAKRAILGVNIHRRRGSEAFGHYVGISFASTAAEYMHGLWHDVQVRTGGDNLPVPELRRRMVLMTEMFPPNEGYQVFSPELKKED